MDLKIGDLISWFNIATDNTRKGVIYKITDDDIFITTVNGVKAVIVKRFLAEKQIKKLN